jgi:hypothetical protein
MHKGFMWENLRERDDMEDTGIHERILLKWIFERLEGGDSPDRSYHLINLHSF